MKTLRPILLAAALSGALAACATTGSGPTASESRPVAFRAEDFAWSQGQGRNAVAGRVAYRGWSCAGGAVGLTPDTPYSRSRVARLYGSTERAVVPVDQVRSRQVAEAGDDYSRFVRQTRCDDAGRFRFDNLPDGSWFVIGRARAPQGQGGDAALMRRVTVRGGKTTAVELN